LAVRVGAARARSLYGACLSGALLAVVGCAFWHPWALIGLAAAPLALQPAELVRNHSDPPSLVAALIGTVRFQLVLAVLLAVGLRLS
jgi:1,4-dihydroxy-2-naphthoate octaprenyltransferase